MGQGPFGRHPDASAVRRSAHPNPILSEHDARRNILNVADHPAATAT
jgi:hypothetical protein